MKDAEIKVLLHLSGFSDAATLFAWIIKLTHKIYNFCIFIP